MRILHVMSCRGWSSDAYWAARAVTELDRAGHVATLVCRRGTDERVIIPARGVGVRRVATRTLAGGVHPAADWGDVGWLARALDEADVVHVHRGKEHWLAVLANRRRRHRRPLVRTRHIVQAVRPHALNRWLYGRATDLVVTVTEAIRQQYVASGLVSPGRVVALAGGVDARRLVPDAPAAGVRAALGLAGRVPLVGLVSGFRVMKGHAVAVEAAERLRAAGRRFHLLFSGRGPHEGAVRAAVRAAGLEALVSFRGWLPDLAGSLAELDVALYPPIESDGMSRVLFEYLACGRPTVASRVGVVPEVLEDGRTALLIPAGEPGPLAEAVARLLDDASLRASLGAAARTAVEMRFSGARLAAALAGHYERLVGGAGRR